MALVNVRINACARSLSKHFIVNFAGDGRCYRTHCSTAPAKAFLRAGDNANALADDIANGKAACNR